MRLKNSQSLILIGFRISFFAMMGGLFSIGMERVSPTATLLIFGPIFLVGTVLVTAGKLAQRAAKGVNIAHTRPGQGLSKSGPTTPQI
jgi:hypothetical protein